MPINTMLISESVQKEIQVRYDTFFTALNNGNADMAGQVFAEDGIIISGMNEPTVGQSGEYVWNDWNN